MINCLVVDDEPFARKIIIEFCGYISKLRVIAECANALEARNVLQQQAIDILFLDIHMPVLDGIGFLNTLEKKPQVIFTTAYKEYAATAFDLAACDYLVKPFSLDRFIVAVDKALEKFNPSVKSINENVYNNPGDHFFIKADGKIYNLHYNEILFAEAKGNYTKIVTVRSNVLPNISFTAFEELLPPELFVRVHRSFIINKSKVSHVEGNVVYLGKVDIPIGSIYKDAFLRSLGV